MNPKKIDLIRFNNLTIIPTYHQNLDFVHEIRKVFYAEPPDVIAVEFPENLRSYILQGVERLPKPSLVVYFDEILKSQLFIPILPSDSLVEAIRLGIEYGVPCEFIDLFVKNYSPELLSNPDSFVLDQIPLPEFYNLVNTELKLDEHAKRHYIQILENREKQKNQGDTPLAEGGDPSLENGELKAGAEAQAWLKNTEEIDNLREHYMASRLAELMQEYNHVLVVIGLAHWAKIKLLLEENDIDPDLTAFVPNVNAELFNVLPEDLHYVTTTPNLAFQWEVFRQRQKLAIDDFDEYTRLKYDLVKFDQFFAIKIIIQRSVERYQSIYNEKVNMHKLKSLFQYLRNLPLIYQQFRPELFDIVLAAKSIVNDDFAWIVWDECKLYPYAKDDPKLDAARLTEQGILLHGRFFKLRRHIPLFLKKIKLPLKPKPKESKPGEWRQIWERDSYNLVSHLPEDVFEENYFQHLRKRTMALMKDQFIKIHQFTSTLMDGIDFRETIRNWPIYQKIYVREERPIHGEVDSVVIIFDRDEQLPERYPHVMMWYAEHNQESDLAVYSTYPGIDLVGPGISRVEIGGVVSFFPPRTVPNIWSSSFVKKYPFAQKKADRALTAAIIYCQKKFVTYVAKERPTSRYYNLAQKVGVKIIFIPLERFNPVSIRALRNIHMLAGKKVRAYADQYVNKRKY